MLKIRLLTIVLFFLFSFSMIGCTARVSTNYSPSVLLDGSGPVNVETFSFDPEGYFFNKNENAYEITGTFTDGTKGTSYIQANEIVLNGSAGTVLLDKTVSEFITEAVKKELKYIGYKNNIDSPRVISGSIRELSANVNSEIDFITKIQFKIVNKSTGKEYSKLVEGKFSMGKYQTREPTTGIYSSISKAIENFVRAAQGNGML